MFGSFRFCRDLDVWFSRYRNNGFKWTSVSRPVLTRRPDSLDTFLFVLLRLRWLLSKGPRFFGLKGTWMFDVMGIRVFCLIGTQVFWFYLDTDVWFWRNPIVRINMDRLFGFIRAQLWNRISYYFRTRLFSSIGISMSFFFIRKMDVCVNLVIADIYM